MKKVLELLLPFSSSKLSVCQSSAENHGATCQKVCRSSLSKHPLGVFNQFLLTANRFSTDIVIQTGKNGPQHGLEVR